MTTQEHHHQPRAFTRRDCDQVAYAILGRLDEPCTPHLCRLVHGIVRSMGPTRALTLFQVALKVQEMGGVMLPDGSRRRTLGGVFFELGRQERKKQRQESD